MCHFTMYFNYKFKPCIEDAIKRMTSNIPTIPTYQCSYETKPELSKTLFNTDCEVVKKNFGLQLLFDLALATSKPHFLSVTDKSYQIHLECMCPFDASFKFCTGWRGALSNLKPGRLCCYKTPGHLILALSTRDLLCPCFGISLIVQ